MHHDIFEFEKKLIFTAALNLIKDGRHNTMSIAEVSYHAGLTESTTRVLFQAEDQLWRELFEYVRARLEEIVNAKVEGNTCSSEGLNAWTRLYEFYVQNPGILAFMEQPQCLASNAKAAGESQLLLPLIEMFRNFEHPDIGCISPEILTCVFHDNVKTFARLRINGGSAYSAKQLILVTGTLWTGLLQGCEAQT